VENEMVERRKSVQMACETVCETVKRLEKEIDGNGQPGIRQAIAGIREELAAMRGAQDARFRYTQVLLAALTIAVALMAIPNIAHALHVGELKFPEIRVTQTDSGYKIASENASQSATALHPLKEGYR